MKLTGWHLINDKSCTHGYNTTCMHTLTHNGLTPTYLSLHLLLPLFSCALLQAVSETWTPCHGQKDPHCVVVFLSDWPRFISHCFSTSEDMLKCCTTLAIPAAALQLAYAESYPFVPAKLLYVKTGEQLSPLVTTTLGRCWHIFLALAHNSQPNERGPPFQFSQSDSQLSSPLFFISPLSSLLRTVGQKI